jgi:hypothetical protein
LFRNHFVSWLCFRALLAVQFSSRIDFVLFQCFTCESLFSQFLEATLWFLSSFFG